MVCVNSSNRSAKVDLPWSMWAMMQKFRIFFIVYALSFYVGKDSANERNGKIHFHIPARSLPYQEIRKSRQSAMCCVRSFGTICADASLGASFQALWRIGLASVCRSLPRRSCRAARGVGAFAPQPPFACRMAEEKKPHPLEKSDKWPEKLLNPPEILHL